jgi:hypothetical protein
MFIGHYGPSFAAAAYKRTIPLWVLFLAVQLVDVVWAVFVLLGLEKVRIVPGITATNPFDLYYMPYTHSLPGALFWSVLAAGAYRSLSHDRDWSAGIIVGAAVFSHWILDLVVHRPDLPLYGDAHKVGLALWNYPAAAFAIEIALLVGGIALYLRATGRQDRAHVSAMAAFGVIAAAIQAYVFFGPPPASDRTFATTALALYAVFTASAYWLERKIKF